MLQRMIQSLLFLMLLPFAIFASADQLTMADGSIINGRIIRSQDDSVEIETRFAGRLVVSIEEVVALHTDEPVTVMLADGQLLHDQTIQSEDDRLLMLGQDDIRTESAIADIGKINPAPWEMGINFDLIKGLLTSAEYVYDWDGKATDFVNKVDQSLNVRVGYQW